MQRRAEARLFCRQARRKFTSSVRGEIDMAGLYGDALAGLPESLAGTRSDCGWDGQPPLPVAEMRPVTLDELLGQQRSPAADQGCRAGCAQRRTRL